MTDLEDNYIEKYIKRQNELIKFMKENNFQITIKRAPLFFIYKVSMRDSNPNHIATLDNFSFVEEYIKNHLKEAKKEYLNTELLLERTNKETR